MAELSLSPGANLIHWTEPNGVIKTHISVKLRYINDGSSPAWITGKSARLLIVSAGEELPLIPQLAKEDILEEGVDPVGPGKDDAFEWNATGNGRHSINTVTIIYGVVRYRDIFWESRETWFCYQLIGYQGNRKLIRVFCGPEYSKHT
jgi:hypothetical protein